MTEERHQIVADFDEVVNMTPKELEEWLETDESKGVLICNTPPCSISPPRWGRSRRPSWR